MSGRVTVNAHMSEYGQHSWLLTQYVDQAQKNLTNMIGHLHTLGFTWLGMIVFSLNVNVGRGHTYSSTIHVEPLVPQDYPVALYSDFSAPINTFLFKVKDGFASLIDTLKRTYIITPSTVATLSAELTLTPLRKYSISMTTTGTTLRRPGAISENDTDNGDDAGDGADDDDDNNGPDPSPSNPGAVDLDPTMSADTPAAGPMADSPQELVAHPLRRPSIATPVEYGPVRRGSADVFWLNVRLGNRRRS
eukprot:symbB.v1.2.016554.t1/scaffold1258.1/size128315/8